MITIIEAHALICLLSKRLQSTNLMVYFREQIVVYLRDIFIIQPEWFIYIRQVSPNVSEHLHSHAEPHSSSLSEHSLQFELRSTAPAFPFLFPSTPNHHVPVPTLNLSFNPPLSVAGSRTFTPPSLPPPSASCARPSYPALPTTTLLYPTRHIVGKDLSFLLDSGTLLVFQGPVFNEFTIS